MATTFTKDPDATLDYTVDWSDWLDTGETISSSSFSVPSGITKASESNTTTSATVWLSGGTKWTTYTVTNEVTTTAGRTDQRSFDVRVVER